MNFDLKRLGHFYFILLLIGSIVFYKERTLYMDCSYHIFNVINTKNFFIASQRYSVTVPELIPLFLVYIKAPLAMVLISFSISYTLLYYCIYLISTYVFKVNYIIIPIMLTLSAFSAQSYFHIVTETHQGLMYTILLFAWLDHFEQRTKKNTLVFLLVSLVIITLAFFAHPVTLFPISFTLGFFAIKGWRENNNRKKLVIRFSLLFLITLSFYLIRAIKTPENSYDGQFYSQLAINIHRPFFKLYPFLFLLYHAKIYAVPGIISLILLYFYWRHKEILWIGFFLFSTLMYIVITQLAFGSGDADVMMEKNFMPFAIFLSIPLCYFLCTKANAYEARTLALLLGLSLFVGISNELIFSRHLAKRLDFYKKISAFALKEHKSKLLISEFCAPHPAINWALSTETLMYSSLQGRERSTTVYINDGDTNNLGDPNLFLFVPFWKCTSENSLNKTYFDLRHQQYTNVSCLGDSLIIRN